MNPNQLAAFKAIERAQQALKNGDKRAARQYAEQAAHLAGELEEVWLMLAALASPHASMAFLEQALKINPHSQRAQKGMAWAIERTKKEPIGKHLVAIPVPPATAVNKPVSPAPVPVTHPKSSPTPKSLKPQKAITRSRFSYVMLLAIFACIIGVWAVLQGVTPAAAFINSSAFTGQEHGPAWAEVNVSKPTAALDLLQYAAVPTATLQPVPADELSILPAEPFTATPADIPPTVEIIPLPTETLLPTDTPQPADTPMPTDTPLPVATDQPFSDQASPTPLPTDTAAPLPTQYVPPAAPKGGGSGGARWIDVDLTHQMAYAYEGNTVVNSFLVSTGTWEHPTVTGQFHIYVKYRSATMSGPGYNLPNVPYVMYFYKGYGLHGTYWHSNFGTPMSHGCVNFSIPDAGWVYNWASVGTLVNVHY